MVADLLYLLEDVCLTNTRYVRVITLFCRELAIENRKLKKMAFHFMHFEQKDKKDPFFYYLIEKPSIYAIRHIRK